MESTLFGLFNPDDPFGLTNPDAYYGCNCPDNPYSHKAGVNSNGLYAYNNINGGSTGHYNYTSCESFGINAIDSGGDPVIERANATACCNYCCTFDFIGGD